MGQKESACTDKPKIGDKVWVEAEIVATSCFGDKFKVRVDAPFDGVGFLIGDYSKIRRLDDCSHTAINSKFVNCTTSHSRENPTDDQDENQSCKPLYDLKPNDVLWLNLSNTEAMRVPGGWIYRTYDSHTQKECTSSCFVPFNNEFQPQQKDGRENRKTTI